MIDEKIDTGNVLLNEKIKIEKEDNAGSLHDKLMILGKELVVKTLNSVEKGTVELNKMLKIWI